MGKRAIIIISAGEMRFVVIGGWGFLSRILLFRYDLVVGFSFRWDARGKFGCSLQDRCDAVEERLIL